MEREYKTRGASVSAALALVVGVGLGSPTAAYACSLSPCRGADVFPERGLLPQDLAAFTVRLPRDFVGADAGVVEPLLWYSEQGDDALREIPARVTPVAGRSQTYLVEPVDKVMPGDGLVIQVGAPSCAPTEALSAYFQVTEARPAPTELGTLSVALAQRTLRVGTRAGSCAELLDVAYADLTLQVAPSAEPFRDVLDYQWIVDGAPYDGFVTSIPYGIGAPRFDNNGHSELGRGVERVWAPCQTVTRSDALISAVALGEHRVSLRGTLRSGATVETPEVTFRLACDGAAAGTRDAGSASSDGGATTATTTTPESSMAAPSTAADAPGTRASDGCSMGHSPRSRAALWLLALTVLGYGLAQRRKRS